MKKVNIIIPYFGTFPNYFQLFLNSCKYNETINWTILSDCEISYHVPTNVKIVATNFSEVRSRICAAFNFSPVIDTVHKLCEYKPAYAYLFPEYTEGYDYWGYGDIDLIYGDIRRFLTDEVLKYDKVFQLGHFTLIKNEKQFNEMFMNPVLDRELYKEAFSSPDNYNFDEQFLDRPNINTIFEQNGCSIWGKSYAADIYTKSNGFLIDKGDGNPEKKKEAIFVWDKGDLKRYVRSKGDVIEEEYMYIHLQKRAMSVRVNYGEDIYKIIPNAFEPLEVDLKSVKKEFDHIRKQRFNNQYMKIRFQNLKVKMKTI